MKESHGRKQLKQRRGKHCLLAVIMAFIAKPFYTALDHLFRGGTIHNGLDPPTSIVHQENIHRLACRCIWWRHFPSWGSHFPDDPSFCQTNKARASPGASGKVGVSFSPCDSLILYSCHVAIADELYCWLRMETDQLLPSCRGLHATWWLNRRQPLQWRTSSKTISIQIRRFFFNGNNRFNSHSVLFCTPPHPLRHTR